MLLLFTMTMGNWTFQTDLCCLYILISIPASVYYSFGTAEIRATKCDCLPVQKHHSHGLERIRCASELHNTAALPGLTCDSVCDPTHGEGISGFCWFEFFLSRMLTVDLEGCSF